MDKKYRRFMITGEIAHLRCVLHKQLYKESDQRISKAMY